MTTRASHIPEKRTVDILRQVVALKPGRSLEFTLIEISMAFGDGATGLSILREIAEDNDCYVGESDVLGVRITKAQAR